jgi:hypothetical protein
MCEMSIGTAWLWCFAGCLAFWTAVFEVIAWAV